MPGGLRPVVWVHGDCLSPHNPALRAYPDAPAIFVWDDALIDAMAISLKRVVFIYECLLELPVTIRRGDPAAGVLAFAAEHNANQVITTASPSPRFAALVNALKQRVMVRVLPVEPLAAPEEQLDLARFSRYWRAAAPYALKLRRPGPG
ncbi:MAG: hypothetical protein Kow00124_10770 [Anaerolineae bacterium]